MVKLLYKTGNDDIPVVCQFRQAVLCCVSGSKASIFVRKTLHIRLRDCNMRSGLLARREGYAFFDEDDVCAGL